MGPGWVWKPQRKPLAPHQPCSFGRAPETVSLCPLHEILQLSAVEYNALGTGTSPHIRPAAEAEVKTQMPSKKGAYYLLWREHGEGQGRAGPFWRAVRTINEAISSCAPRGKPAWRTGGWLGLPKTNRNRSGWFPAVLREQLNGMQGIFCSCE